MSNRARESLIAIAASYVGTTGNTPAFQELLGPIAGNKNTVNPWPLDKAYGSGGVSTCAVVARGFLRKLGVPLGPYETASGLDDAISYAKKRGAWRTDKAMPVEGSVVELQGETSIHVLTVEKIVGTKITSIDGGQVAANTLQTIARVTRGWSPGMLGSRPIVGWIDPAVPGFVGDEALAEYPPKTLATGGALAALASLAAGYFLFWRKKK